MKKNYYLIVALIILPLLCITAPVQKAAAQDVAVSYQTFYDELAPYGQWVNDPSYGDVWVPNVPQGFRPYATDGHWVMTDNGNMWMSDEPWAWAAYHYGRWTYNGYYGWVWIPGYEWAPAWVNWRSGGGYYGWAPMGPGQVYGGEYEYPANYWVFVNPNYLYQPNIYTYYEHGDMGMYVHRTEYIHYAGGGDRYYGPRRDIIERDTHHPVEVYRVSAAREAGVGHVGGHEVSIYRPAVNQESARTAHPASIQEGRDHPIGSKPEPVSADHESKQPAFRQEQAQHVQQNQQQHMQQQQQQQPRTQPQQQPRTQPQQQPRTQPQQQPRTQPQQQPRTQPQQQQRTQPQPQQRTQSPQQQRSQPQQQQRTQPQQQQKAQPKPEKK